MFDSRNLPNILALIFLVLIFFFMSLPVPDFSGSPAGHGLGITGFLLMAWNLVYSYRKRIQHKKGRANPLTNHAIYGLLGGILVVVHAGTVYASPIGTLIFLGMLLVVLSGVIGKILFLRVNRTLREHQTELHHLEDFFKDRRREIDPALCRRVWAAGTLASWTEPFEEEDEEIRSGQRTKCRELAETASAIAETENTIGLYSATRRVFSFWIAVHIYSTVFLFALAGVHILTTLYYGVGWPS